MRKLASIVVPFVFIAALGSCRTGVAMWTDCAGSDDKTATDSTYVLVCKDGTWQPVMTVGEFVRIKRGERVTIAPLPTRPVPTTTTSPTTSTTAPTTSTTAGATTTTAGPTTTTTSTTTSTTTTTAPPSSPVISGVAPTSGSTSGGTSVIITGTSLTGATLVTFGGVPATSYTVNSSTQITAVTPAHAAGAVNVVVNTTVGGTTAGNAFTYV